jgi:glycosyltransferase involved in cell wall biosynthesis
LRILILHNRYQRPGGEDIGSRDESVLLGKYGHDVKFVEVNNDHIHGFGPTLRAALTAPYSRSSREAVSRLLSEFGPDLVHIHNFFPTLTPSAYFACNARNVPVVQTLHNYRLLCPAATFFRGGKVCESCLGRTFAWPGVFHGCYRDSRLGTAAVANIAFVHHVLGTFRHRVAMMVFLSEFSRQKFLAAGYPPEKLVVKPCFVDADPGVGVGDGGYVLFVGRLSEEKGVPTLLKAWEVIGDRIPLFIAGEGPLEPAVRQAAERNRALKYLGFQARDNLNELMRSAQALVFPSTWFEGMPRTIIESFACGTPVIASRIGSMAALIDHGRTGLHFVPGDANDLVRQLNWMRSQPQEWKKLRHAARMEYEAKYTPELNYTYLMQIYEKVLGLSLPEPSDLAAGVPLAESLSTIAPERRTPQ